jgi:hypothetical protein
MLKKSIHLGAALILALAFVFAACKGPEGPEGPGGVGGSPYTPDPAVVAEAAKTADLYEKLTFTSITAGGGSGGYSVAIVLGNTALAGETPVGNVVITRITLDGKSVAVSGSALTTSALTIPVKNVIDAETFTAAGDLVVKFKAVVGGVLSAEKTLTIATGDITAEIAKLVILQADVKAIKASTYEVALGDTSVTPVTASPVISLNGSTSISGSGLTVAAAALDTLATTLTGNTVLSIGSQVFRVTASAYSSGVVSTPENVIFTGALANSSYKYDLSVTVAITTTA